MGYSARYHAASLVAVFLALAVGILIGAGLGDNLVSDTEANLRESLEGDIEEARGEADDLQAELDRERAFSSRAYPALVGDRLVGERFALMAFGDLPADLSADIEAALEPTGADLVEVAVVRRPPDVAALGSELSSKRAEAIEDDPAALEDLGETLGEQFALGEGNLLTRIRDNLFSRSSGEGGELDGVILTREPAGDLEGDAAEQTAALETGLTRGVAESGVVTVGVERSSRTDDSSIPFFAPFGISTVDSVDLVSGRVALVFALLGAEGNFGIKDSANSLLPELLSPSRGSGGS